MNDKRRKLAFILRKAIASLSVKWPAIKARPTNESFGKNTELKSGVYSVYDVCGVFGAFGCLFLVENLYKLSSGPRSTRDSRELPEKTQN